KFAHEHDLLEVEVDRIIAYNRDVDMKFQEVLRFCKENKIGTDELFAEEVSSNSLVIKAQDRILETDKLRKKLPVQINDAFSQIEELLVKEKGYLNQNRMYQKRIGFIFIRTSELRKKLCKGLQENYPFVKMRYDSFSKEVVSWGVE